MNPSTQPAASPCPAASAWTAPLVGIGVMLTAVAVALWLGGAPAAAATAAPAAPAWLQDIETGADHIEPLELAHELLHSPQAVLLIDLRPTVEFAAWHLPGAVNLTVPELCGDAGARLLAAGPRRVVLYSNGPAHPGQAWVELRRQGHEHVSVLAGGLTEFLAQVLTPPSLRGHAGPAPDPTTQTEFARMRAHFLGAAPRP